jgi:hypothetical protein
MSLNNTPDRQANKIEYVTLAALFLSVSVAFLRKIYDFDIWFHLAIGREVLTRLRIPATEIFVYPLLGAPGAYHEWGFGTLVYLLFSYFRFWGISIFNGVIAGLVVIFLYSAANGRKALNAPAILLLAVLLVLVEYRFVYRPETILYLFLAIELFLLERFSRRQEPKWLFPIPALCFLLSYFHPSSLILIIVLLMYLAGSVWDSARDGQFGAKPAGIFLAVVLASVLASILNPYGIRQLLLPVMFAGEKAYLQTNPEFRPVLSTVFKNRFILLALAGLAPIIVHKGGRRITHSLLYMFFGFLAFKYLRNLAMFAIILYPSAVHSLDFFFRRSNPVSRAVSGRAFHLLSFFLLISTLWVATPEGRWGSGPVSDHFPMRCADFMLEFRPGGRIFNFYDTGNYLEWKLYPAYLVSIDGRHYTYDKSFELTMQVFSLKEGWQKTLQDYNVGVIITPSTYIGSGFLVPLVSELYADPAWSLAVVEPRAMLFIRTDLLAGLTGAQAVNKDLIWERVIKEALNNIRNSPGESGSYLSLGMAFFKLHRFSEAGEQFKKYLSHVPADSGIQRVVSLIDAAGLGDHSAGETLESIFLNGRRKSN